MCPQRQLLKAHYHLHTFGRVLVVSGGPIEGLSLLVELVIQAFRVCDKEDWCQRKLERC